MSELKRTGSRCRRASWGLGFLIVLGWGFLSPSVHPAEPEEAPIKPSEFLRFVKTGADAGHVDTAITTYQRNDGASVALVAAVRIADADYYRNLQNQFTNFDAVLFEMVKPKEGAASSVPPSMNPIRSLQTGMKRLLDLEFQLDAIDYARTNFVHADLDAETFNRLQKDKGESILGLLIRAALDEQNQKSASRNPVDGVQFFLALMSPDSAHRLKLILAEQLEQIESLVSGLDQGPDGKGSVLVSGRNQKAMEVLAEQLRKGKRSLAIFYGAGHMPDLEKRLAQGGFKKSSEQWLTAWDIRKRKTPE